MSNKIIQHGLVSPTDESVIFVSHVLSVDPSSESSDMNVTWSNHRNQESKKVFWLGLGGTGAAGHRCYEGGNGTTGVGLFWGVLQY